MKNIEVLLLPSCTGELPCSIVFSSLFESMALPHPQKSIPNLPSPQTWWLSDNWAAENNDQGILWHAASATINFSPWGHYFNSPISKLFLFWRVHLQYGGSRIVLTALQFQFFFHFDLFAWSVAHPAADHWQRLACRESGSPTSIPIHEAPSVMAIQRNRIVDQTSERRAVGFWCLQRHVSIGGIDVDS